MSLLETSKSSVSFRCFQLKGQDQMHICTETFIYMLTHFMDRHWLLYKIKKKVINTLVIFRVALLIGCNLSRSISSINVKERRWSKS